MAKKKIKSVKKMKKIKAPAGVKGRKTMPMAPPPTGNMADAALKHMTKGPRMMK